MVTVKSIQFNLDFIARTLSPWMTPANPSSIQTWCLSEGAFIEALRAEQNGFSTKTETHTCWWHHHLIPSAQSVRTSVDLDLNQVLPRSSHSDGYWYGCLVFPPWRRLLLLELEERSNKGAAAETVIKRRAATRAERRSSSSIPVSI